VAIHSGPPLCRPLRPVSRSSTRAVAGRNHRASGRGGWDSPPLSSDAWWHVGYFSSSLRAGAYNRQERTAPSPICQKARHLDGQRAHAHTRNGPPDHPIDRSRERGAFWGSQARTRGGAGPSLTTRWRGGRAAWCTHPGRRGPPGLRRDPCLRHARCEGAVTTQPDALPAAGPRARSAVHVDHTLRTSRLSTEKTRDPAPATFPVSDRRSLGVRGFPEDWRNSHGRTGGLMLGPHARACGAANRPRHRDRVTAVNRQGCQLSASKEPPKRRTR